MPVGAVRTVCPYCGVGCGVLATPDGQGGAAIAGDPEHPANFGRLCSKGSALGETLGLEGRLLSPSMDGRDVSWDAALDRVAGAFRDAIATHGPESVAIYGSGQLLTEDYYVANKLMKGFIGSANIDTNSRLCMASSVAGQRRAFGSDTVPGTYEDLEEADLVVLVGSNLAWCHPVLYQRITAAREARPRMRLVVIDPRRTASCDLADLHLPLRPDSDVALFNGLLARIESQGAVDAAFVGAHVSGFREALAEARGWDVARVAAMAGLDSDDLERFYRLWIGTEKVVTVFSQGVNQSRSGTDKVNAILNCHLATGRVGKPGSGPFSVTGQPNAMGGREVGGLSNLLTAHLDLDNAAHRNAVAGFWNAPNMVSGPGLKAVDLFRACGDGRIKALWILSSNPVVSMPDADAVAAALRACEFVAVSDMTGETDTARLSDVLLPAAGWGEKSGTVTNSERRISRQRAFLAPPGEARSDWQTLASVGQRLGWTDAFAWKTEAEVFREHASLSALAVGLGGDFDIGALAELDEAGYEALDPVRWPVGGPARFFADGGFHTPDGRGSMIATAQSDAPVAKGLHLNTGRIRDHWHTMTRTGRSARLSQHIAEPYIELHPEDADRLGIRPADLATVSTRGAQVIVRALVTDRVGKGQTFVPMHWSGQTASQARIGALIPPVVDPISGQPAFKLADVEVRRFTAAWHAFAVSGRRPRLDCGYWALARCAAGWRCELAGIDQPTDWEAWMREAFDLRGSRAVSFGDPARGAFRIAMLDGARTEAVLFVSPDPVGVSRSFVTSGFGTEAPAALLAGHPGGARSDPGPLVCACFDVGANAIAAAIASGEAASVAEIGALLRAGTNCGSCRPEIGALLKAAEVPMAAE